MMLSWVGPHQGHPTDDRFSESEGAGRHKGVGERVCPTGGLHLFLLLLRVCVCVCVSVCMCGCVRVCV